MRELPEEAGVPILFGCIAFGGFVMGLGVAALLWWLLG